MKNVLVLGGGLVGSVIARDLATAGEFSVTVADLHPREVLRQLASDHEGIELVETDCSSAECIQELALEHDLVVGAMPGRFGFQALRAVIESGRNFCDISFMPEDAWELDGLARERGVTCVVDMGVAPGMSNLLAGTAAVRLDPCRAIDIYVGGIPAEPVEPFKYKAAFSPADVIEEYTRPSRLVEDGAVVIKPALSEPELIGFPGVGTLEAFNTDGLRSLVDRLDVPFMREKTMRYPGHRDMMLQMREAGFFDQETIQINGVDVCPRDVAASLLFPHWTYEEGEADLTVMRVTAAGMLEGKPTRLTWDLHDQADPVSGCSSMSRTTAFPCTIMARMIASGEIEEPGVHVPEDFAAREGVLESLLRGLEERGVRYTERIETLAPSD
ncbi:MAG: saccharopine dehydrogenase C-terminal domain-containing protein [Planctomycetota bacterium]|nr:saccharopine dehydrogenase C-terminal domain-containing protein [Planctomycetota bacterium]